METSQIFAGADAFRLKDEAGLPLAQTFIECEKRSIMIDWIGLIEAARAAGWWDYQTMEEISVAFTDSGAWPDKRDEIIRRLKVYVVKVPHPKMKEGTEC